MKSLDQLPVNDLIHKFRLTKIPYDISWMAGKYFIISKAMHNQGDFELFYGKCTKLDRVIRLRVFGVSGNILLEAIDLPLKIGVKYNGDLIIKINDNNVYIEVNNGIISLIDIISDSGIKHNNGYFRSIEKLSKIEEAKNSHQVHEKLQGIWDFDFSETKILFEKNGNTNFYDKEWARRFVIYLDNNILNVYHYINCTGKELPSNFEHMIAKVTRVNNDGSFTIKSVSLNLGAIDSFFFKFDGEKLLFKENILLVHNKTGEVGDTLKYLSS